MSKWSKSDREIFNSSEVLSNMESNLIEKIVSYANMIKESQQGLDGVSNKMEQLKKNTDDTSKAIKEFKGEMENLAEDSEENELIIDEEDQTKEAIMSELNELAKTALLKRNYSDLYKIERAIQELKDGQ